MKDDYDIAVVGGGLVGLALACKLETSPYSIAVIEPDQDKMPTIGIKGLSPQVLAINMASKELLQSIGAWQLLEQSRCCPYNDMLVWDGEGTSSISFDNRQVGCSLGTIVETHLLLEALNAQAKRLNTVEVIEAKVTGLETNYKTNVITLDSGQTLRASLMIGADGSQSIVRKLAGIDLFQLKGDLTAIVCGAELDRGHKNIASQCFTRRGPLAFLPMTIDGHDNICSIVWSVAPDEASALLAMNALAFVHELNLAHEQRLFEVSDITKRYSFPISRQHAIRYVKDQVVLIGDAAHTIHPLAGQGINLGFADVSVLAEEIRQNQGDLSGRQYLARYQRRRRAENVAMFVTTEVLNELYSGHGPLLSWIRNAGMRIFDRSSLLKKSIARRAVGA